MKKPRISEKLFLEKVFALGRSTLENLHGVDVGQIITLIRHQLRMSQRALAKRANTPQSTIARVELGNNKTNISTLKKILDALDCDLIVTVVPREDLETIQKKQARAKAERKIQYLHGTMSLEQQSPSQKLLTKLIEEEEKKLLDSSGSGLWEDGL